MRNDLTIYDDHAEAWWDGSQRFLRLLHNLVPPRLAHFGPIAGGWHGKHVLDLGCGGGFMAEALAREGAHVVGVDPAAEAIRAARTHARTEGLEIEYRVGVGEAIPLEAAAVDAVVCVDVLEHVADLEAVLAEIRRVLRPGGLFFFDTINRTPLAAFVVVFLGETVLRLLPRGTHDPALFIPPKDLSGRLQRLGFRVGAIVGLGPRGLNRRLDLVFGRLPTRAVMYMGHAIKTAAPV